VASLTLPVLTIEPGTEINWGTDTRLFSGVGAPGEVVIDAETDPVVMGSTDPAPSPGRWDGLEFGPYDTGSHVDGLQMKHPERGIRVYGSDSFTSATVTVDHVETQYAQLHGVIVDEYGSIDMRNVTVLDGVDDGVHLEGNVVAFENNTISGNDGIGLGITPAALSMLGSGNTYTGNGDERIHVLAGNYDVTEDVLWEKQTSPYVLHGSLTIGGDLNPTLTLGDGVIFECWPTSGVDVTRGSLQLVPGPQGVLFTSSRDTPSPGDWRGVRFLDNSIIGPNRLEGLTVEYGGLHPNQGGLWLGADNPSITGVSGNEITGNAVPIDISHQSLFNALQDDNLLTGNDEDVVVLALRYPDGYSHTSLTVPNVGLPWRIMDQLIIADHSADPVLTIEAGNRVEFGPEGWILLGTWGDQGRLEALSTASEPIVFTSMAPTPAPGDWYGLSFQRDSTGLMQHVTVEYGGGGDVTTSVSNGGVNFRWGTDVIWEDGVIRHSANYGATQNDIGSTPPDLTGITFVDNALGDMNW